MAGNAGLFGGIGPVAAVNQAYAPQQAYLQQQQASRNAALQAIFQAILGALPSQQSVDAPYMAASQDTNNLARASAAGLQAANPDAQTQAGLRAIGAPASQQQQVGNIDNTSFNGNAALLQYAGGVIPSGVFNQDMQARNTYLASLPGILAGYAKQGVGQLAGIADKENMGLASDRANSLIKARTDLANFVQQNQAAKATAAYKKAQLGLQSQKLGLAAQNQAFNQTYKTNSLKDTNYWKGVNAKTSAIRLNAEIAHWSNMEAISRTRADNAKANRNQKQPKISTSVSNMLGYLSDSSGNPIGRKNGRPIYTDTLPPALAKQKGQIAKSLTALQPTNDPGVYKDSKGGTYSAQQAYDALIAANPSAKQTLIKQQVILKYGVPNVPSWMNPLPAGAGVLPESGPWNHQHLSAAQQQFSQYVTENAKKFGIDPRAVLAVSKQEGFGGGVGDQSIGGSYGPFQLYTHGALPKWVADRGHDYAQRWAWSPQGWDYALRLISKVARGKTGAAAVDAIVRRFEKPAKPGNEVASALGAYGQPLGSGA